MIRDLVYLTDDYSIRCCYGTIVFNYWFPFDPDIRSKDTKRRLYVFLYGFDLHVFNRKAVYEAFTSKGGNCHQSDQSSPPQHDITEDDALGWIWAKFERLFPIVRFNLETSKICFGNHLIPRAFVLTCQKAQGNYTQKRATWRFDKYQHWMSFEFQDMAGSLVPVVKYSGHYAVEEPPQKAENFRVFFLGRGCITYKQDQPGLITSNSTEIQDDESGETLYNTFPEWNMMIAVNKDLLLAYGPWADRQRDMLWKFFLPPSYKLTKVTPVPSVGQFRTTQKFSLDISSSTDVQMDLWFAQNKSTYNKFAFVGGPASSFKLSIPWVVGEDGSTMEMALNLAKGSLITDCLWHDLLTSAWFDLKLNVHYPRHWNSLQTWSFDLTCQESVFCVLFSQKAYFKGFFDDWSSGSRPDILYFIPYIYKFKFFAQPLELRLLANDYNWVAPTAENAFVSFCTEKCNFDFDLPFVDFLPTTVQIKFDITASTGSLCLSVPETSTLLYMLKEVHENLRLAGSNCKPLKTNPFRIIEEVIPIEGGKAKSPHKRYWIECWRAPRALIKVGYTYYPIAWVPDFWLFLPKDWEKHSAFHNPLIGTKASVLASRDPEEAALGDLRPEGSKARGPTESELIKAKFDPSYMAPDQIDIHVSVPSSQLLFYGALIRHLLHIKETYFGCYQTPITTEDLKEYGLNKKGNECLVPSPPIPGHNHLGKTDPVVDPREFRPLGVRITFSLHNLQAHLPIHTSSEIPLCPTAFLDCIGFEMDKNFHETKLQLLFSPALLCVFDKCNSYRPPNAANLSTGRGQLTGFELRGHAMFSNRDMPLRAETVEYAWMFEITCGTVTGQITAPQLSALVQCISNLVFSAIDLENAIFSRRSGELCQHGQVPTECPFWSTKSSGARLCPTELELKYRLFRFNLDGVELAIVEAGTCLMIMLDAVRVARCNMHDVHSRDGISVFLPRVQFLQLIKPIKEIPQILTRGGNLPNTFPSRPWLEAGSLGFGPVHLHSGIAGLDHAYRSAQLVFIRRHDEASHRLWFLWLSRDSITIPETAVRCGCYGNCSFFGPNASGRMLLDEVLTGVFSRRAVFINDLKRPEEETSLRHPLMPFSAETPERSLGVNFGESLLEPDQLLFHLHNSNICSDTENGFALMRLDAIMADEAAKFDTTGQAQSCYCSSEEEDENEGVHSESSYSVLSSSNASSHPSLRGLWRKDGKRISQTSLEKPLVEGEGERRGDDNMSISSLLDDLSLGLPTTQVVSPPPPPPRQFGATEGGTATRVSTSSVPLFTDTVDTASNQKRGSTNSLQFDHGATSKASEDSTLSGEDFAAKFVDLHGQLNRSITESSLLRTAYERHLNRYITNADLCPPLRLKHRWRVCRRLRQRQQSSVTEAYEEERPSCNCRIGIAKAPEFLCCATGFSFRSMVDSADDTITENSTTAGNDTREGPNEEADSAPSSFRIADLRPLLYPHSRDSRIFESSTALVSRSSTTVSVLGPVDIFLTPLCTECLDRYITIMTPVVANRSPSAVIDELYFKCLLSAGRQGKVLYEEKLNHQYPSPSENVKSPPFSTSSPPASNPTKKGTFFDQFSENTLWFHRFGSISVDPKVSPIHSNETQSTQAGPRSRPDVPAPVNATEESTSTMTDQPPSLSGIHSHNHDRNHHLAEENNLVGLLSLGRVNIGFMQIYAVEDVVTVDSLTLGLNDLTCVSLLTLAVDAVKVQVLNNKRILHVGMGSRELEASQTAPLQNTASFSHEALTRGLLTTEEKRLSEVVEENDEDNSTAASPLLSSPHRSTSNSLRQEAQTASNAPTNSKPNLTECDIESGPTIEELRPQPLPKVVSATEVRHTERLVCNFSISRIHSQLRRLTRESSFTPDVLLTAIPFSASRVFFSFDADQSAMSRQAGTTRKSPPAVGGLYTGVHGPTPSSSIAQLYQPPPPSSIPFYTSESALPGHSAGWIMFESGMEELTLLFVQRKGYGDSLEEKSDNMATNLPPPSKRKFKAREVPVSIITEENPKEVACVDIEGIKNAFLMNLHVKTVWLNFPAPKHLPNKRRMEIIRSDWNFLSTMTPTVNAWIGPCYRLVGNCKNLIALADRRTLSVLACLMMEAVNGDRPLPDFRFSSIEDEVFSTISTLRTPDARRLRYDPSCQIFTTLRRYLQALRRQHGPAALNSKLNDCLRESVLPEKMTLLRGLFLILREWRVAVDVLVIPQVAPVMTRKFTALLSRKKEDGVKQTLHAVRLTDTSNEPLERRPSGLTLRMFELMTQNTADSRTVNATGGEKSKRNIDVVEEIDEKEDSDLDDESLINDPRIRKENTILYRFLQDAQHGIRQSQSIDNIPNAPNDDSPIAPDSVSPAAIPETKWEFGQKLAGIGENTEESQPQQQRCRSPSITPENMNQINHLKGQFRFVDDAQRLFRPLLEAIGVNIKGVRRSTLMKKFGGLFAAEGMLHCFQIEICDSLENPLQKVVTSPVNSGVTTSARRFRSANAPKFNASGHSANGSTQRALMCHRFSTKITLMDVVGFGKQENGATRLGDIELRSTTTKIIVDLHVDSISQHSNMPLFRLTHQFVTMFYCAQDAQKSADRRRNLILARPSAFDAKGSVTDTVETGSTLKSRPDYIRLSGHSQDSTTDSTAYQHFSNLDGKAGDGASISIPGRGCGGSQNILSPSLQSSQEPSYGKTPDSSTEARGDELFGVLPSTSVPPSATGTTPQNASIMPECWRRMLRYIDLYSTIPETKNVIKKASTMPTIVEEGGYLNYEPAKEESGAHIGAASGVAGLIANAAPHFSFIAATRHDSAVDVESGLLSRPSVNASYDSVAPGTEANGPGLPGLFRRQSERTSSAWFKTSERIPTVVLVTMRVRQMTVSAVLSEVNLTAVVRGIHGSFTKTNRVRGHSLFKEKLSNFSFTGHFGDGDIRLTEGIGKFAQKVACMRMDHSHVLLSCVRSSRHAERNACTIGLGRVEIAVPHHPVRLHGMVQRQARHLSTTVSEFLQIPTNSPVPPSASSRKRTFTDGGLTPTPEDIKRLSGVEERHLINNAATPVAPLIINVTAIARGLTINVCLHPSLDAVYAVDPVYFFGRIGPNGYLDMIVNTHSLSFQSVHLPIMFPRAVSLSLPKILASLTQRQSLSGNGVGPQVVATREGSYLDAQVSVGFFEQRLPSDRLNYIMVVVKLFMKEINEVIRKMAGEQQPWQTGSLSQGGSLHSRQPSQHYSHQPPVLRRCSNSAISADPFIDPASAQANRLSVSTRFSFRLKFGGILLLAKTSNGAVKFETSEMHVELSNRVGRTHMSWYTDSLSSFSAARPHADLAASTPPTIKKVEKGQPTRGDSTSRHQAPSETMSITSSESILIYAKIDHLSIELGHLDQDVFYEVWDQEFRTLAFFRTAIALRSLLAEEVSPPNTSTAATNVTSTTHRNAPFNFRSTDETTNRHGHSRPIPPRMDGEASTSTTPVFETAEPLHSGTTSVASSVVITPLDDCGGSNTGGGSIGSTVGQEAFLVLLRRPIIWVKPSAFDRAILIWMVYNSEFAKWNEHLQQLDALSSETTMPSSRGTERAQQCTSSSPGLALYTPPERPLRLAPTPSLSSPSDGSSTAGSLPKNTSTSAPQQQPPVSTGPILFFQLNVEDLGICLPTNILQLGPQSMELDSRTAIVLTLEQSRISACLRGSLVSEGEFTDFCLRFDDDFNVGSDDWKPDKTRSTVTVKKENHLVVMNGCVVPSGTFQVCWKAVEALRAEERGRWLLKIQYEMRGLDVHLDDNIGRRLNALFEVLTTVTSSETDLHLNSAGAMSAGCEAQGEDELRKPSGSHEDVDRDESSLRPSSINKGGDNVFQSSMSVGRGKALEYRSLDASNLDTFQQHSSQYRRFKWSNLRRKATIPSYIPGDLRRTSSLVKEKHKHDGSQRFNSGLTSPTPIYDDPEPFSATGSSNALALSSSSRTDSIYFDAEDRGSANAVRLDAFTNVQTDTNSLQEEPLYDESQHRPAPPPRKHTSTSSVLKSSGHQPPDRQSSTEEPPRSSLLLELDVNIHVDSGRCGLHPRLPKQEGGGVTGLGGRSLWPSSPAIGNPCSLQDDLYKAYLSRYKRQLSQDPRLKPTDVSVFYLPALDVGFHYKSHTNYDIWNQQSYRSPIDDTRTAKLKPASSESEKTVVADLNSTLADGTDAPDEAARVEEDAVDSEVRSKEASQRPTTTTVTSQTGTLDVGRSADLYASVVLQKLPQTLIVHPGLLDFLEQALENLPASAFESESDDAQSNQPNSSVQLNDALMISNKTFMVDVVVHLRIQPSSIRFLCLPDSQMQCLISLPSLNVIFSTERLAEESFKDADGKPINRFSIPVDLVDDIILGDLVSASGLNVTAILNEFRMSVFHPYGGGIGGGLRPHPEADGTSPGDSLTLKVHDIRLNISRTVQTNIVGQQSQTSQLLPRPSSSSNMTTATDVRAATATMTSYVTASSGANSISLHNIVRFSGVIDIGVAEFNCDTRRSLEILHLPKAWYRNSLARALFIGKDSKIPRPEPTDTTEQPKNETIATEDDNDDVLSEDEVPEIVSKGRPMPPSAPSDTSLANWLQKGPRLSREVRPSAGTAAAPIKLSRGTAERVSRRRSATAPREGMDSDVPTQSVSTSTTLPPPPQHCSDTAGFLLSTSRGYSRVVSWQAVPIFYAKIGHLDIRTYMGSAMGRTKLDVRNVFCDGRLYQDSSKRRHGSLGAGVHLCQFNSEQGIVGGEFTLLDLESRVHFKEDPRYDPQHSAELLIQGFQLRIEYMNTNIVFLRLNQAELYLNDEWKLREASHLSVSSSSGDTKERGSSTVLASRKFSMTLGGQENDEAASGNIGAPPVYVMIAGEINWDQLQVAIARTTTVDLVRSTRKVREYFEEQLREGRNSWIGQGDYLLRPESSCMTTGGTAGDSLSLPTESGETFEVIEPAAMGAALGFPCTESNVDSLLQRHWQKPILEGIRACLVQIGAQAPHVRKSLLESTAPPDESSVPPVLGGSLQLAGNSLALACFAGTFRSAPDWAVFNMQHPTICFETEAQREPRQGPKSSSVRASTINKKAVAFACDGNPDRLPQSIDEVGGWLNVRQVLSLDLGHQLQYRPQTAYVLRVRRGREQNPVKLLVTPTIAEWLEFMFMAVDITVLSHVRGANPHYIADVVKLTNFAVDFTPYTSSTTESIRRLVDAVKSRVTPDRPSTSTATTTVASPPPGIAASGGGTSGSIPVTSPSRPNPLKPPTEAEILFVLPSVSMRLTSDQRQSMANPVPAELLAFARDLQNEKALAAGVGTAVTEKSDHVRESNGSIKGQDGPDGRDKDIGKRCLPETLSAKVHLSFQTDLHGVIQLGLLDVPWLPFLIKSYINEQMNDIESMATPDPSYAVTARTLELAKEGLLPGSRGATAAATAVNTASPIVKDLRSYDVIHWSLSPECRLLLASNIDVPAFDKFLENIGFQRARTTIPKWLQRGVLDHLDSAVAGMVHASLRLVDEERKEQRKREKEKSKENRSSDFDY
nr:Fragile site associated protein C terminal [Hymenolepis microstoma]